MTTIVLPLDAASGSPSFSAQATRQAFSALAGAAPSGRPLGATSGVRPGTPSTTVTATGFTWSCAAHAGVLDVQASATAGPYLYATDGTDTGSITAANGTNPRVDIIYVQVNDNVQDSSGSEGGLIGYLAGTPAASPVAPSPPNSRCMVLANISVPVSGGGNPSVSWVAPTFGTPAWTSYVPSTNNVTVGNGTLMGSFVHDWTTGMVKYRIIFTFGSTSSFGGTIAFGLPSPLNSAYGNGNRFPIGVGNLYDSSAQNWEGAVGYVSTVAQSVAVQRVTNGGVVNATLPWTWAAGDQIMLQGSYQGA